MTLRLPRFEYVAPRSIPEAVDALVQRGPDAMVVAGGTDLYPNMKRRMFTPRVLVGLRRIPELHGIGPLTPALSPAVGERGQTSQPQSAFRNPQSAIRSPLTPTLSPTGGEREQTSQPQSTFRNQQSAMDQPQSAIRNQQSAIRIGACTSLAEVAASPEVLGRFPALATAAALVSTPQLRNMGTIGGNICLDTRCNYYDQSAFWRKAVGYCMKLEGDVCRVALASPRCLATFSADTVPALIGYDATVRLVGPEGERVVPLRDLYQMDGMHWIKIQPGEILVDVALPDPEGLRAAYYKLRDRGSFDFPLAGVFVGVQMDEGGLVQRARLVLTGVYSMPIDLTDAQDALVGNPLEPDVIAAAAEAAYAASRPVDNTGGTIMQRRRTIRVFVRRALEELAVGIPTGGSSG